ncbi:FAD/NAD(P)-binding protein [Krasilnikovia sp. M28-CT-15]|uniref:FAD/NAD(P)-binding protein n=1 Tax=Krasilnikovia sp. M28-CT-15 TaxID=3373540 RepID=UPI003875D43C
MTTLAETRHAAAALPLPYRVVARRVDTYDTVTLELAHGGQPVAGFAPGQFAMLTAYGIGEVPISLSGVEPDGRLIHTIRAVGAVTRALTATAPGGTIGVRGPFGTGWDLPDAAGGDVVIVAGGIGLAPLRPLVLAALADRARYGRISLLVGARTPADLLYPDELHRWRDDGIDVEVTVDRPDDGWTGHVGVVTTVLAGARYDPANTTAFLCGPEVMMRFTAQGLLARGLAAEQVRVSLERTMRCGVGWCGHCQLGPLLLCRDGPVVDWSRAMPLTSVREL